MSAPTPNAFSDWIDHRAQLLRLHSRSQLADRSGISLATLNAITRTGSLRGIDRSTRAWLARALKVPLREMECFAAGKGPAISDLRRVDFDHPGGASTISSEHDEGPAPIPARCGRGIPIVGHILSSDQINWFASGRPESQRRLPIVYPGLTDVFALSEEENLSSDAPKGECLIFRNEPPPDLSPGDTVLLTFTDGTPSGQSRIGQLSATSDGAAALVPFGRPNSIPMPLPLESIVRAARLLGRFRD